jgi:hypothetical protein
VLQTPFGPVHCALVTHWTHSFATLSQTGSAVVQALTFGSKHSWQLPSLAPAAVMQAGSADVGHDVAAPPTEKSAVHGTQVPAALQMGVLPEH